MVGFAIGSGGLDYGFVPGQTGAQDGARGIVFADITGAVFRGEASAPEDQGAATVFGRLAELSAGGVMKYSFGDITDTELAGRPALTAAVTRTAGYSFIEWPDLLLGAIGVNAPSRLVVADVGERVLLAQIWISRPLPHLSAVELNQRIGSWTPVALEFIQSLELGADLPDSSPADQTFSLSAWERPDAGELRFGFRNPAELQLSVDPRASVVSFTEGGRGVVVADITGTYLYGGGGNSKLVGAADEFVDSLRSLGYELADISRSHIAGFGAAAFDISVWPPYAYLQWGPDRNDVTFAKPSRLIVANVNGRVIMAQIWVELAATRSLSDEAARLADWLPVANEFLDSLRLYQ
jgi:hypothetical protein